MSTILTCPVCNKLVTLTTNERAFTVCSCKNVFHYKGKLVPANFPAITEFPELIQPGTTGKWNNQNFIVSGRIRVQFSESCMNFWDLRTEQSEGYWLMEGYGLYAILEPTGRGFGDDFKKYNNLLEIGKTFKWQKNTYLLEERELIREFYFEGETRLAAASIKGNFFSFASPKGINYVVIEWIPGQPLSYRLTDTSFDALTLKDLRQPEPATRQFFCEACNTELPVTIFPYTGSVVCKSCYVQHSWKHDHGFVKRKGIDYRLDPAIPLGAKGTIKGIPYTVTGYSEKEEAGSTETFWREFTLHNPVYGFAFLSEYNGHWIYLRQQLDGPVLLDTKSEEFELNNERFVKYNSYQAKVRAAEGEFPYDIFNDEHIRIIEYISPPEMWSREFEDNKAITWFYGEHIRRKDIQDAFSLKELPLPAGIGAVQPTGYMSKEKLSIVWLVGMVLLLLIHGIIMLSKQEKVLYQTDYVYMDAASQHNFVTPKFELDKALSNIEIEINAPVNNSWFELGATLVNTQTGAEFSLEKGVEYYSGRTDGESWSEGDTKNYAWFTAVPKGTYMLQMQGTRPTTAEAVNSFSVSVKYDVTNHRNFLWVMVLWSLFLLGKAVYDGYIESKRWGTNPFATYNENSLQNED